MGLLSVVTTTAAPGLVQNLIASPMISHKIVLMTSAITVARVVCERYGSFFYVVLTDLAGEADLRELSSLSDELGGVQWDACVIDTERLDRPHAWFPGSTYSVTHTVYRRVTGHDFHQD
jgi:hypothetical protein